jgi:hypothetical protein
MFTADLGKPLWEHVEHGKLQCVYPGLQQKKNDLLRIAKACLHNTSWSYTFKVRNWVVSLTLDQIYPYPAGSAALLEEKNSATSLFTYAEKFAPPHIHPHCPRRSSIFLTVSHCALLYGECRVTAWFLVSFKFLTIPNVLCFCVINNKLFLIVPQLLIEFWCTFVLFAKTCIVS